MMRSLTAPRVRFYSRRDEDNFFSWLNGIAAVKSVSGVVDTIISECDESSMTDEWLRELVALFYRYRVDTDQLDVFLTEENKECFLHEKAFWRK
jgi:hypothetical protein